ncbi:cysteine protease [Theileria equi strain WA]|uniref:Cysteine protease n=1 Tax=Theileria equi strain WA TaxID=1537102 RepID=L1LCI4_THEEQ|nr:cysteine protease [Theileria equi strain WA]EKX72960.1 cysteine protease [Theileria equi strain WA]|eukprot:XP_004832412.1 cysteine protease [Theileria equi strain WA]
MVAVVSTSPNERLIENRVDDDVELNDESASPISLYTRFFAKKRTVIFASTLALLLLVLASTLTGVFVARHRAVVAFRENLTNHLNEKFTLIEPEERAAYVAELTDLFRNGYITDDHVAEFEALIEFVEFNKVYSRKHADADERRVRFLAFRDNYNAVKAQTGEESYEKGINQFSDMTKEEFERRFPAITIPETFDTFQTNAHLLSYNKAADPVYVEKLRIAKGLNSEISYVPSVDGEDLDWRRCGGVSKVKDQGNCGSCWAFAAVGSVESLYLIHKGETLDLSEQELVNCETHSHGCDGGFSDSALRYIKVHGLSSSSDVPYFAKNEVCYSVSRSKTYIDAVSIMKGDEILNKSLVLSPTVVFIAASEELTTYKSGIYNGSCSDQLNHAVLLVGEGHDEVTGKRYWIIKNSWGPNWGENGFLRLERTFEGTDKCGVLEAGMNPILN